MHHLKVAEVARRLAIKPKLVKQFIETDRLKAIRIPTEKYDSYRTSEEWYSDFVESLKVVKEPEKKTVRRRNSKGVREWV